MPSSYMSKPSRSGFGRKEEAVTPRTSSAKSEKVENEMRSYHAANSALSEAMLEVDTVRKIESVVKLKLRTNFDFDDSNNRLIFFINLSLLIS